MTVLITGANRGIGRALHDAYAERGAHVIGTSRGDSDDGMARLDVTDPGSHRALAGALKDTPIGLLICNAGVYLDKHEALDSGYAAELWAQTFAANVTGVFLTIQSLLPNLRAAADARIAIISSVMASDARAPGGSYIYRASKAAVLNLGRNLAVDLRPEGIAVGIYHPGWIRTDMGGPGADLSLEDAVPGLLARFDELDMSDTGCFRGWDGRTVPY